MKNWIQCGLWDLWKQQRGVLRNTDNPFEGSIKPWAFTPLFTRSPTHSFGSSSHVCLLRQPAPCHVDKPHPENQYPASSVFVFQSGLLNCSCCPPSSPGSETQPRTKHPCSAPCSPSRYQSLNKASPLKFYKLSYTESEFLELSSSKTNTTVIELCPL